MISIVKTFLRNGIKAVTTKVECEITPGVGIHIVGIRDQSVNECLLRTETALQACGYRCPGKKVVINIAPASRDILQGETALDLPIALAILAASGQESLPLLEKILFAGELGLDGSVRYVRGGYPAGRLAMESDILAALPAGTAGDAQFAAHDTETIYRIGSLADAIRVAKGEANDILEYNLQPDGWEKKVAFELPTLSHRTLRILTVAATAGFDLLITGKTSVDMEFAAEAARAYSLLAADGANEETFSIHSVAGQARSLMAPYREVPCTVSAPTLLGGSPKCLPGLVSMVHGGTLVMKDASLWSKSLASALRVVHEDNIVTIKRLKGTISYPARFRLVMTDAKDSMKGLADKIDSLHLAWLDISCEANADRVSGEEFARARSLVIRNRIKLRMQSEGRLPAEIPSHDMALPLDGEKGRLMNRVIDALGLSARTYADIVRLAVAIDMLDGKGKSSSFDMDNGYFMEAAAYIPCIPKD